MTFKDKVRHGRAMFAAMLAERDQRGEADPFGDQWEVRFPALMKKCEAINTKRNKLIHSVYVHLESGGELIDVLRTKFKTGLPVRTVDAGDPKTEIEAAIKDIAGIAFDITQAKMQLVAWS